ncbi:MAG: phage holin family protein [Saprospiraceae bacterium]|nr:phage holin family protein [Saprospiraceae bacterium]
MSETTDSEALIHRLYEQVVKHLETRWAYLELTATEKASALASNLAGVLTIIVFLLLVLFFFSMGFAWWLGDVIGNRAGGFALAGLVFIPIGLLAYRLVRPAVRDAVLQAMIHEEENKEETTLHE